MENLKIDKLIAFLRAEGFEKADISTGQNREFTATFEVPETFLKKFGLNDPTVEISCYAYAINHEGQVESYDMSYHIGDDFFNMHETSEMEEFAFELFDYVCDLDKNIER